MMAVVAPPGPAAPSATSQGCAFFAEIAVAASFGLRPPSLPQSGLWLLSERGEKVKVADMANQTSKAMRF